MDADVVSLRDQFALDFFVLIALMIFALVTYTWDND